jgi:hypothetical protein
MFCPTIFANSSPNWKKNPVPGETGKYFLEKAVAYKPMNHSFKGTVPREFLLQVFFS